VGEAFDAGADIVTVPPAILQAILNHPKTAETAREFDAAWEEFLAKAPTTVRVPVEANGDRGRTQPATPGRRPR
jgi:transaldolase